MHAWWWYSRYPVGWGGWILLDPAGGGVYSANELGGLRSEGRKPRPKNSLISGLMSWLAKGWIGNLGREVLRFRWLRGVTFKIGWEGGGGCWRSMRSGGNTDSGSTVLESFFGGLIR